MSMKIGVPDNSVASFLTPKIAVFGVGGAGTNAVNNMISEKLDGVDFIVANTDAQSLNMAVTEQKIQLGVKKTMGLGAGARPEVGRDAALEAEEVIRGRLEGMNMLFLTAGMGGGTGTGATPVVAKIAKDMGILTVAFITKPFSFEGRKRMQLAENGIRELSPLVDALIIIPNQKLFCVADRGLTFANSFKKVDNVLYNGVKSVTDLMLVPGLVNLDFADVRTVMAGMGKAMMGTGNAEGEGRAMVAVENAILNPLLDNTSMKGATKILVNIRGSDDLTLEEVDEAMNKIYEEASPDAEIIFGSSFDTELEGRIMVSIVATGLDDSAQPAVSAHMEEVPAKADIKFAPTTNDNVVDIAAVRASAEIPEEDVSEAGEKSGVITAMPHAVQFFRSINGGLGADSGDLKPKIMQMNRSFGPREIFVPAQPEVSAKPHSGGTVDLVDEDLFNGNAAKAAPVRQKTRTSLFERVTGLSKNRHSEDKEPSIFPNINIAAAPHGSGAAAIDDGLDIPTFLRR